MADQIATFTRLTSDAEWRFEGLTPDATTFEVDAFKSENPTGQVCQVNVDFVSAFSGSIGV